MDHFYLADRIKSAWRRLHGALYDKFCSFVREVFESPTATIKVPSTRKGINVSFDGRPPRSIKDFGTGLTQILMIAAACSFVSGLRVFIEEPETNLHPTLLRKLADYLLRRTNNQYFISTHAASLIDTPGASVFHVEMDSKFQTKVRSVFCHGAKAKTCFDLGYRASDIIQANCIIWVEGPSDRIYVRHWLKIVDPALQEVAHFSMMFYGGGLYVYLSGEQADHETVQEGDLMSLVLMNQHSAFITDSDRFSEESPNPEGKVRIENSLEQNQGWFWITDGREIENYVPIAILAEVAEEVHPRSEYERAQDQLFGNVVRVKAKPTRSNQEPKLRDFDKVEVAKRVVARSDMSDLPEGPLRNKVRDLAQFIRRANGIGGLP